MVYFKGGKTSTRRKKDLQNILKIWAKLLHIIWKSVLNDHNSFSFMLTELYLDPQSVLIFKKLWISHLYQYYGGFIHNKSTDFIFISVFVSFSNPALCCEVHRYINRFNYGIFRQQMLHYYIDYSVIYIEACQTFWDCRALTKEKHFQGLSQ